VNLVNILARDFQCFNDEVTFHGRKNLKLLKRAQILVADIWAAFNSINWGTFTDIHEITMFADYRIPQMLNALGCLQYDKDLEAAIMNKQLISSGHKWEVELRGNYLHAVLSTPKTEMRVGCSIWCVELIRKEIIKAHPDAKVNAILIDFYLYDTMKELERSGKEAKPHHRTRSIWY